jgi:hypothetical protein
VAGCLLIVRSPYTVFKALSCFLENLTINFRKRPEFEYNFSGSDGERQLRRLWRFLGWFVVVNALITIFGVTTAPLLLAFAADAVVGLLIIRSCFEMRDALPVVNSGAYYRYSKGGC